MERNLIIIALAALMAAPAAKAQSDDFGVWYEVGAEKKLSMKWNVAAEAEFRTRDNSKETDRWSVGINAEYKLLKGLKASAGYTLLYDNHAEELDLKSDGLTPNKWTPTYWSPRHRLNLTLSGSVDWQRLRFSLRERWQYTYRPVAEGKRYDIDENSWMDVKSKTKNVLRSRLQIDYDIPNWKFDPYVSVEMFNASGGIEKMRYTLGVDYKWRKQHVFGLSYKYQNVKDDEDSNRHILGISYKYKF